MSAEDEFGVLITAMVIIGLPAGPVRSPLADATPEERVALRADLLAAGVDLALAAPAVA